MVFQPQTFQTPTLPFADPYGEGRALNQRTRYQSALSSDIENRNTPEMLHERLMGKQLANRLSEISAKYAQPLSEQKLLSKQLANQLSQATLPYAGPKAAADLDIAKLRPDVMRQQLAKGQFGLDNPLLSVGGAAGQVGAMQLLAKQLQEHPEMAKMMNGGQQLPAPGSGNNPLQGNAPSGPLPMPSGGFNPIEAIQKGLEAKTAQGDLAKKRTEGYDWSQLPMDSRRQLIAQAAGIGMDETEALKKYKEGKTFLDLAEEKGFDRKHPEHIPDPIYPAGAKAINTIQQRQAGLAEMEVLSKFIRQAVGPYAGRTEGISAKQLKEAITGKNEEQQANFVAAAGLMPEQSGLRGRLLGAGNLGVEAIREITNASMGKIRILYPFLSEKVYKRSQEIMDQKINESVKAANSSMNRYKDKADSQSVNMKAPEKHDLSDLGGRRVD